MPAMSSGQQATSGGDMAVVVVVTAKDLICEHLIH
jgi:hypothetical protein